MNVSVEKYLKQLLLRLAGLLHPVKDTAPGELPVRYFKRILIVRQHDQLGDLLIATPAIRAVRKRFPNAHIGVVVREYTAPMMWDNPNVDEIIVFREKFKEWSFRYLRALLDQLRHGGGWDCTIMLNTISRSLSSDIIAVLSKAKFIVGPDHLQIDAQGIERIYDVRTPQHTGEVLEIERNLAIVNAIGIPSDGYEYDLALDNNELMEGERIHHELGLQSGLLSIGVHFGGIDQTRRFPLKKLAQVIDWLKTHYECQVVLVPGPREEHYRDQILGMVRSKIRSAPVMPIRIAAAFIQRLNLFLCNDTGTLHIAAAMKVPTVSFHSINDPAVWKPPHERHIAVRAEDKRIASITVDQVVEAVQRQIQIYSTAKPLAS